MAFDALQIANEIISRSAKSGRSVTNLSLQKLAFFAHGWHLALVGTGLIAASFEAWRFGPVVPSLYHKFKSYSANPIPQDHPLSGTLPLPAESSASLVIDKVLEAYGNFSGAQLVAMSHAPNGPWHKVYHNADASTVIPDPDIAAYFKEMADRNSAKAAR